MKTHGLSLWLIAALLTGCATRKTEVESMSGLFTAWQETYAADFWTCPFGHDELKDIPIEYGFPNDSDELNNRIENHEVWLGGCCVGIWSPTNKVLCQNCQYHYVSELYYWEKDAKNPDEFSVTLDEFISKWPRFSNDKYTFFQKIKRDGTVTHEILVWSSHSLKATDQLIAPYLENQPLEFMRSTDKSWRQKEIIYTSKSNNVSRTITIEHDKSNDYTFITAKSTRPKPAERL